MRRKRPSPSFRYSEFSQDRRRAVHASSRPAVDELCRELLQPLRDCFGRCTVISGNRSEAHNRAVGGAPRSKHVYSRQRSVAAADVVFARGTPAEWAALVERIHPVCGMGVYRDHLHLDTRKERARWSG